MRLDWIDGCLLYCRRCDAAVPHYEDMGRLVDDALHEQSPHNPLVSLSVADDVDPAVMLLPRGSWNARYLARRERLLAQWASKS